MMKRQEPETPVPCTSTGPRGGEREGGLDVRDTLGEG